MPAQNSDVPGLRNYVLARQQVAAIIRAIQQASEAENNLAAAEQARDLLVDLAEDRFNLAVVGQFKRGKSSLMNAVIGRDLLPTGFLPLTSAITTLCYGPQERVILLRRGWRIEQEVSLNELADYVTERGNPGNEKGLVQARVELPVDFLRRGLHFIDTPGIGSTRHQNTATTYEFLPKADAVIFVTSVEAPLSEAEETFLQDIRGYVRRLFVVVNKTDLLPEAERVEVLSYVQAGLERVLEPGQLHLYPLSARQALAARLVHNDKGVRESGLTVFETDMSAFLSGEKERTFLVAILDRAERVLRGDRGPDRKDGLLASHPDQLESLGRALAALRADLLRGKGALSGAEASLAAGSAEMSQANLAELLSSRQLAVPARRVRETGACPICEAQGQAVFDFFVGLQSALVTSAGARRAFANTHGLCCIHTWQFHQIASPQAICDGYAPLIEQTAAALRQGPDEPSAEIATWLGELLASPADCLACAVLRQVEAEQVGRWLADLAGASERGLDRRASALCLPHLWAVLAAQTEAAIARKLLDAQARRLEEIAEDMRSYALKRAALRRSLQNSDEEHAWVRALWRMVGQRTACS